MLVEPENFYLDNDVDLLLGTVVMRVDSAERQVERNPDIP